MTPNLTAFTGVDSQNLPDVMVSVQFILAIGDRKKKAEIQRILKNYTIMDAKTRKALQDFGFRIEEDGKHYRLTFFGDDRYNTTVAKTPSDARAGKNIAHYIEQTMM